MQDALDRGELQEHAHLPETLLPGPRFRRVLAIGIALPFGLGLVLVGVLLWQISHNANDNVLLWTLLICSLGFGGFIAYGTSLLLHSLSEQYESALRAYDRLAGSMEKRIEERTEELERANRELEAFSYSVSHDLRAPLRSVASFSMILQEDLEGKLDADSADNLARIRTAAAKMTDLIDALLRFSRIARAKLEIGPVDLSAIAEGIIGDLRRNHPNREVDVEIQAGMEDNGDPHLMHAVLENVLENAWKFTSRTHQAKIEFGRDEESYFVRDNGVGFEKEYVDKIFMPFERLHSDREFPGTGIGLATTKRVIERHGGRIWADSEVGKGAVVRFTLGDGNAE